MNYRADIDGLRAIAVLSVILFHLDITLFSGGFVGVDIFFVISGYLITSIIKNKHENDNFNLKDFYLKRVRRLAPPLITTIAISIFLASLILTPIDMVSFSRSVVAALFSFSNIIFFMESGYWDTDATFKPLLHTWSLGVEEQFYLIWPVLLILILKIRNVIPFWASLFAISISGATLCAWYTSVDAAAAFYLLPFRVFQFSLGALIIPASNILNSKFDTYQIFLRGTFFYLGLLTIIISIIFYNKDTVFPGFAVLLPTLGSMLVIIAGGMHKRKGLRSTIILGNRVLTWIGKISYSAYLVHWPLISFYRYHSDRALGAGDQALLFAATIILATVMFYGVERRFYSRGDGEPKASSEKFNFQFSMKIAALSAALAGIASTAWLGGGWNWRTPTMTLSEAEIAQSMQRRYRNSYDSPWIQDLARPNELKKETNTSVLIIGNSHWVDGYNFLNAGYKNKNLNLIKFGSTNQCRNFRIENKKAYSSNHECQEKLNALLDTDILGNLDYILYASSRPYYKKGMMADLFELILKKNPSIRLITYGGYIETVRPCSFYISKTGNSDSCLLETNVTYFEDKPEEQPMSARFKDLEYHYIDRVALLCKHKKLSRCLAKTDSGIPMFYDQHHLSLEFAEMNGKLYAQKNPNLLCKRCAEKSNLNN